MIGFIYTYIYIYEIVRIDEKPLGMVGTWWGHPTYVPQPGEILARAPVFETCPFVKKRLSISLNKNHAQIIPNSILNPESHTQCHTKSRPNPMPNHIPKSILTCSVL